MSSFRGLDPLPHPGVEDDTGINSGNEVVALFPEPHQHFIALGHITHAQPRLAAVAQGLSGQWFRPFPGFYAPKCVNCSLSVSALKRI